MLPVIIIIIMIIVIIALVRCVFSLHMFISMIAIWLYSERRSAQNSAPISGYSQCVNEDRSWGGREGSVPWSVLQLHRKWNLLGPLLPLLPFDQKLYAQLSTQSRAESPEWHAKRCRTSRSCKAHAGRSRGRLHNTSKLENEVQHDSSTWLIEPIRYTARSRVRLGQCTK